MEDLNRRVKKVTEAIELDGEHTVRSPNEPASPRNSKFDVLSHRIKQSKETCLNIYIHF